MSSTAAAPDDLKNPDPPEFLWHYTSANSLTNIVESGEMWASHIAYLNDAREYEYALSIIERMVERACAADMSEERRTFLRLLPGALRGMNRGDPFVCSFSALDDDLDQWRAYCPSEAGYALGIESSALRKVVGPNPGTTHLVKCAYTLPEQEALLPPIITSALAKFDESRRGMSQGAADLLHQGRALWSVGPAIKHPAFRREEEWRLVHVRWTDDRPQPNCRPGRNMFVPYIPLRLRGPDQPRQAPGSGIMPGPWCGRLRLVVGPTAHPELAERSARRFLEHHGVMSPVVTTSKIPFRPV